MELMVGDICRYYGVIKSIHGDLCEVVRVRRYGKYNVVMIEGAKKGNERRGVLITDLREHLPNPSDATWEV
ncbi:MAG: hypothetical protein ACW99G_04945 [Candidatus Thorarchaeota archaeon]|jgi:hypothetical protein